MAKSNLSGFLNVYKSSGMTAHDVVAIVRKLTGMKQVGHAGTLDPMARGVLPIALGKSCRLLRFLQDDKVYKASIQFGKATDTDDIEGQVISTSDHMPSEPEIKNALTKFVGAISQRPPIYSAVHVGGERLYKLARKGEVPLDIPMRHDHVHSIDFLSFSGDSLDLRIHCSTGTYIRSIARDLGELLGTYACLRALERERAGAFELGQTVSLEELSELATKGVIADYVIGAESKLTLPEVELNDDQYRRLGFGQTVEVENKELALLSNGLKQGGRASVENGADEAAVDDSYVLSMFNGKIAAVCKLLPKSECIVELKPDVVLFDGRSD